MKIKIIQFLIVMKQKIELFKNNYSYESFCVGDTKKVFKSIK